MKERVLTFIIGALVGAIITTGVFLFINKNNSSKVQDTIMKGGRSQGQQQMDKNFTPGEVPSGERIQGGREEKQNTDTSNATSSPNKQSTETQKEPKEQKSTGTQTTDNS